MMHQTIKVAELVNMKFKTGRRTIVVYGNVRMDVMSYGLTPSMIAGPLAVRLEVEVEFLVLLNSYVLVRLVVNGPTM